ncbi:MAG: dTDP-4-dehydrorhamnose reductase [Rickettsiales bacterium]|jgi:dTDP-4-dehydrorhamnose reductase|nr:dTDP-4-dehydrorhamnose reductase [Rickettsiales bacterium]
MYLVVGANGQLGNEIRNCLGDDGFYTGKEELDITNSRQLADVVKNNSFRAIINCSAYTAVDRAESEVDLAVKINVEGVKNLVNSGLPLIHISTDYVFDGEKNTPYTENDTTNPLSIYGKTKLAGENEIVKTCKNYIIIRTSWLYSQYGGNFLKTMLRLGKEKESLDVIFDQVGTPTYAKDLAQAIVEILPKIKDDAREIYNFSNEGVCSWFDFATEIMKEARLKCKVHSIESKDYKTVAIRPKFSVLNKSKIKRDFDIAIRYWRDAMVECIKNINKT